MRIMLEASHKYIKKKNIWKLPAGVFQDWSGKLHKLEEDLLQITVSLNVTENEGGMVSCIQRKKKKIMNYEKATNQWEKKCKEDHFAVRKDSVDF